MNQILLIFFILANIFNGYGKIASSQKLTQVKPQAPVLNLSNFSAENSPKRTLSVFNIKNDKLLSALVIKKLPEDVVSKISASDIFIKEIGGAVIYGKNTDEQRPIASLTKLMTGLISFQVYPETEKFKISKRAVDTEGESGSFFVGEIFERNDLVKAALVASSNDAAYTLAEKITVEKFVELMNSKSKELGMKKTLFSEPTGLENGNKSSLEDLYVLVDYISRNYPEILSFARIEKFTLTGKNKRTLNSTDYLLPVYKKYVIASKTGFTPESGECLILVLKFEKSPFVFVGLLNSKNRFEDAKKLITALEEYYK